MPIVVHIWDMSSMMDQSQRWNVTVSIQHQLSLCLNKWWGVDDDNDIKMDLERRMKNEEGDKGIKSKNVYFFTGGKETFFFR